MSDAPSGRIFLSYRRNDTRHIAGRLFDRLAIRFGTGNVFMDVDSIEPGLDFGETIERAVGSCDVLLVVIGPVWLDSIDERGRRRIDDPDDLVAIEIKTALDRQVRVIPVLVDGAPAPRRDDLPEILAPLARRNGVRLDHETFSTDITTLMTALDRALLNADRPPAAPPRSKRLPSKPTELSRITHTDAVRAVVFSPDGTRLATTSARAVRIWDPHSGKEPSRRLTLSYPNVMAVVFSPDGTRLATASADHTARVWDPQSAKKLTRLPHDKVVSSVVFSPDGTRLATASADHSARVWDSRSGKETIRLTHNDAVSSVVFSPDGSQLATASARTVRVWDPGSGKELTRFIHDDTVWAVVFSPDGSQLATASADHSARVWDSRSGKETIRLTHNDAVSSVVFSPDGSQLATASARTVRVWH